MERAYNMFFLHLLLLGTSSANDAHFVETSASTFHQMHDVYCKIYASGPDLTDLTCVTLAQIPVLGYIDRLDGQNGESSCRICGPNIKGPRASDKGRIVWASATSIPGMYLLIGIRF